MGYLSQQTTKAKTMTFIQKYGDWIWKVIILLCVSGNLYLNSIFLTRNEYNRDRDETKAEMNAFVKDNASAHALIQTAVSGIDLSLKLLTANQTKLDDHETRIRTHAEKIAVLSSKVDVLDVTVKALKDDRK